MAGDGGVVPDDGGQGPLPAAADGPVLTRLVVVRDGAATEYWADSWRVEVQDGGRTAKFFAQGSGDADAGERSANLGRDLAAATDPLRAWIEERSTDAGGDR